MVKAIDSNSAFPCSPRIKRINEFCSSIIFGCAGSNPAGVVIFISIHNWLIGKLAVGDVSNSPRFCFRWCMVTILDLIHVLSMLGRVCMYHMRFSKCDR